MKNFANINIGIDNFLNSENQIEKLIISAKELNIKTIGLVCDNSFDKKVISCYEKCLENGIKPIIGIRFGIVEKIGDKECKTAVILYAKNQVGFDNLLAVKDNYLQVNFEDLRKYFNNLICVFLPRSKINNADKIILDKLKEDFKDDFYFGLNFADRLDYVKSISENNKIVLVHKVNYTAKNDYQEFIDFMNKYYDAKKIDADQRVDFQNEYYIKGYDDIVIEFKNAQELIDNTLELTEKVEDYEIRKYVYELCVIDSKDELPLREIIGIFTEEELEPLKLMVEENAMDMNEGCYDFVYIDKVLLNSFYPHVEERFLYKYIGDDTYKYIKTVRGDELFNYDALRLKETLKKL